MAKFAVQPEIILSKQGTSFDFDGSDLESNYTYVNAPILAKLYLIGGLNLQAGPQFGFLASAKQDILDEAGNIEDGRDVKDQLKGTDISVGLGAGWDLPFGLTIDARYNLGLSDVSDQDGADDIKNQVFQISVGYRLISIGK